jgi:coproporphyrinogen III oxidase-like Fe-S oxidoreductase
MNEGIDIMALQRRFGCALSRELRGGIEELVQDGFLVTEEARVRVTDKGRLVLDEIAVKLI